MTIVYTLKVIFVSWMIGHAPALVLQRVLPINTRWQVNLVANAKLNTLLGVGVCKRVLARSFIQYFNRRLRIPCRRPELSELVKVRDAMTYAEIVHVVGFAYVVGIAVMNVINEEHQGMTTPICAVNVVANLYPALVQQMNKRRIDRAIRALGSRNDRR
ncbi:MAG: hypothetical protein CMJ48_08885 [Planctomycetaceae bacterium]|nr:hypothetical protein [Planctomycetaceae bacterium]